MEPYQIYAAIYLAIFLISRIFNKNEHITETFESNPSVDIIGSALGSIWQIDD
jgi:hypothetical protein